VNAAFGTTIAFDRALAPARDLLCLSRPILSLLAGLLPGGLLRLIGPWAPTLRTR